VLPIDDRVRLRALSELLKRMRYKPLSALSEVERLEAVARAWDCFDAQVRECYAEQVAGRVNWRLTREDVRLVRHARDWAVYQAAIRRWREDPTHEAAEQIALDPEAKAEAEQVIKTRPAEPTCEVVTPRQLRAADLPEFRWPTHLNNEQALLDLLEARRNP
jgi:hypothetical protein